jgi:hypothetical protein
MHCFNHGKFLEEGVGKKHTLVLTRAKSGEQVAEGKAGCSEERQGRWMLSGDQPGRLLLECHQILGMQNRRSIHSLR